jgi:serine/threonine-protein kinase RsbW
MSHDEPSSEERTVLAGRVRVHGIEEVGTGIPAIVARLAEATGLGHSQAYRLRLATEEIATNIVTHGYRGRGGRIDIDAGFDDEWAWVRLEDDAPEFDPHDYDPAPRLSVDPSLAPLGGFGLFLALSSVDLVEHTYAGGRNRNLLKLRRRPADGGNSGEAPRPGGG